MSSLFDEIDAAAQAVINAMFGEDITFAATIGGEYSRKPDPSRLEYTVQGTPSIAPKSEKFVGQASGVEATGTTQMSVYVSELWISCEVVATMPWRPKRGDTAIIPGQRGQPRFLIAAVNDGENGDLQIILA